MHRKILHRGAEKVVNLHLDTVAAVQLQRRWVDNLDLHRRRHEVADREGQAAQRRQIGRQREVEGPATLPRAKG